MGVIISCCFRDRSSEDEPLIQDSQRGYGANANNDYDALQRKLEQEEQKLLVREQELTEIVNSTNDKLIDISMMSNSGIVVQSHDLDNILGAESEDEHGRLDGSGIQEGLKELGPPKLQRHHRDAMKKLYAELFSGLDDQLMIDTKEDLIVTL
ncbi:Meh1p [Lachancea thermotolerans CBS 6340]|uniref:KLTH0D06468p n=1 Tax=Lachancea thermotolerans (strain ATCC 56472 / CBS 6340 / NRRL Y-8284) TaxID=559295 RepID=C5DGM2_LACTC|nr:KLTH0D06468p [Lachancea thermotolerans CBS 6340]CAR22564.1 KLTH0D06468p [Lachancea thermotolerans CBS 6340]